MNEYNKYCFNYQSQYNSFCRPFQGPKRLREDSNSEHAVSKTTLSAVLTLISSARLLEIAPISKQYNQLVNKEFSRRIANAADKIIFIDNNPNDPLLKKNEIYKICCFIEKYFHRVVESGTFYLSRKQLPFLCDIEFDPETNCTFLHTKCDIACGKDKYIRKSILYDANHPTIVATACFFKYKDIFPPEIEFCKKLLSVNRSIRFITATHSQNKDGCAVPRLITKFYPLGILEEFDKSLLSFKDRVSLARELMEAIKDMHALGIAHNDILSCNVLIEENDDPSLKDVSYRLVLMDYGDANYGSIENFNDDIYMASKLLKEIRTYGIDKRFNEIIKDMFLLSKYTNIFSAEYWYNQFDELFKSL